MGVEIERKFLVLDASWKQGAKSERVQQGYLSHTPEATVRIRRKGAKAYVTIKGLGTGISHPEYEYPIPVTDAEEMLKTMCGNRLIDKTRYEVEHQGHTWEVDEFHGAHAGLVIAEIELGSEAEAFARPAWLGREVTGDPAYLNANLASGQPPGSHR